MESHSYKHSSKNGGRRFSCVLVKWILEGQPGLGTVVAEGIDPDAIYPPPTCVTLQPVLITTCVILECSEDNLSTVGIPFFIVPLQNWSLKLTYNWAIDHYWALYITPTTKFFCIVFAFVTPGQWDKYESASLPLGETQAQYEPSTAVIKGKRGVVRKEQKTIRRSELLTQRGTRVLW